MEIKCCVGYSESMICELSRLIYPYRILKIVDDTICDKVIGECRINSSYPHLEYLHLDNHLIVDVDIIHIEDEYIDIELDKINISISTAHINMVTMSIHKYQPSGAAQYRPMALDLTRTHFHSTSMRLDLIRSHFHSISMRSV